MAGIRQWVAWAEQKIAGVIINEGLHCGLCEVKQGPLTITFRVRLIKPTPVNLRKILSLAPTLAQVLQIEGVRILDTAKGVLIELESPTPRTPHGLQLAKYTQEFCVAVGFDQWRKSATVDLKQHPTLLFVGPTRKGKTSGMKSALFALAKVNSPENLRFVVLSQKHHDWLAFENAKACLGIVSDPVEAIEVMKWGAESLLKQRARRGGRETTVLFVIDDLVNLLKRAPAIAQSIGEIASMGGGVNLFQFIGTQHAGSKSGTGGSDIEDNLTARIVYKPASASSGARSAGLGGLGLDQLSDLPPV
jgi:DNA segregation ATPase FtsK/SpoIIIE-like protein